MIKATSDKVIVEFLKREITKGGIIVPEQAIIDPQGYGKVLSVGEEVTTIEIGEYIVFHPMGGMDMVFEKKLFKVLKYDEVYGIIEDKELISQFEPLHLVAKPQMEKPSIVTPAGGQILNA